MNNKKIGTQFEKDFCEMMSKEGFWVHFLSPDSTGAQPFDVIAVRDGIAYAIDCKTSVSHIFPISRLEFNQIASFMLWMKKGNREPLIAVKYREDIYFIGFLELWEKKKVDLDEMRKGSI